MNPIRSLEHDSHECVTRNLPTYALHQMPVFAQKPRTMARPDVNYCHILIADDHADDSHLPVTADTPLVNPVLMQQVSRDS